MSLVNRILTYALGLFLISSGVAKFTVGHVFQYIEYQSGLDVFYPYVNNATGVAEIAVGLLILIPRTRLVGATGAAAILAGAVAFHLSPWLGVSMPTGLVDGAAAPWTEADFATTTTSVTFVLAIVTLIRSVTIIQTERRARAHSADDIAVAAEPARV
ncbi:MAG: hypothetical protein AB8G26_15005 [Ilumatobacter sp.]